jgi:hypothetical protein
MFGFLSRLLGFRGRDHPERHLCSLAVEWRPHFNHPSLNAVIMIDGREFALFLPRSLRARREIPYALPPDGHWAAAYVESLLLRRPAVFGIDRHKASHRELLICHCGDPGCGCVSAKVTIRGGRVRWNEFTFHQAGKPPTMLESTDLKMGELNFDLSVYASIFREAAWTAKEMALQREMQHQAEESHRRSVPHVRCSHCGMSLRPRDDGRCAGCGQALERKEDAT